MSAAAATKAGSVVSTSALILLIFAVLGPYFGANFVLFFFMVPDSVSPFNDFWFVPLTALQAWPVALLFGGVQAIVVGIAAALSYYRFGYVRFGLVMLASIAIAVAGVYFGAAPHRNGFRDLFVSPYFYAHPFAACICWLLVKSLRLALPSTGTRA